MGRPLVAPASSPGSGLSVDVFFARSGEGFRATLKMRGPKAGERLLEDAGPSCAALAEAVSVTVALLLDLEPRPEPVAAPAPDSGRGGWIGIAAGPVLGQTAAASLGFGPAAGLQLAHWSIELGGTETMARSTSFAGGSVRVGLTSGFVQLCRMIDVAGLRVRTGVCARGMAGQLRGEGEGYPSTQSARLPWIAAGAGLRVGGAWGRRLIWGVTALLEVPLRQQTFSIENAGIAYESSPVAGALAGELGVRLF
jgi:hypothetical protein